jgi:hypothetical protein
MTKTSNFQQGGEKKGGGGAGESIKNRLRTSRRRLSTAFLVLVHILFLFVDRALSEPPALPAAGLHFESPSPVVGVVSGSAVLDGVPR